MLLGIAVAFGYGVLSFAAPCTAALLPTYISVLSGSAAGVPPAEQPRRLVAGSLLYVAGFTAVFGVLGLLAGSVAANARTPGGPVQRAGGVVVIAVALLLLAEFRLGLLTRLSRGGARPGRPARSRALGAPFALGMLFGAAFAPCVGPFLATALALAATSTSALRGGVLLAAYAVGIGVPFVIAALAVASSAPFARRLARLSRPLSLIGAVLLAALGVTLVVGEYDVVTGWLARLVPLAEL
ncbi:MAG TPA: cytochrome c biogenesis protein CcdA [Mycobacteriales bacterium]|nr:cytochrome c biogenesis protein CcdA [Mycobacteriales bacterium]